MRHFVKGNPNLCMGCRTCMIGCVVAHQGKRIFDMDPDGYTFNPKLHMVMTRKISVPVQCKHCENPVCLAVCPEKCINVVDNTVIINEERCIGCKNCMDACPFGAIDMVEVVDKFQPNGDVCVVANKCDLCHDVSGGPACVRVCPNEALELVTEEDFFETIKDRRLSAAKTLMFTKGM